MPAFGMPKLGGFPQVWAGCAACGCCWLNDSEKVRLDKHAMDVDTAEALAGIVRLLRLAALRAFPETALELIMKTIGGDGLPKMN